MIIDFYTGLSFEAYWPQVRDDGYHIDCFFQTGNQEKGVSLFAEFLGIDPGTDNDGWKQAKGWESRPVIVAMSDRTMTTGALVPFPHSGSPGTLNREGGHFDLYLKDSTQSSKQPSKTVLSYQATAKKASTLAKIELASQVLKRRRLEK